MFLTEMDFASYFDFD